MPDKPLVVVKQLKIPNSPLFKVSPQGVRQRFEKEADILRQLGTHEQIPALFAHFEEGKNFFLVQDYIDGHDFQCELDRRVFDESDTIAFLSDTLKILSFVHSKRIIHRDIKPQNIIRSRINGNLNLIDFGAVKEINFQANIPNSKLHTLATLAIGTEGYIPNEQANGKPRLSSDLYSLGIIGIQSLTGLDVHQIKEDDDTGNLLWRQYTQVRDELYDFLNTMTHSYHSNRFKDANEALNAIAELNPKTFHFSFQESDYFSIWYARANSLKNQGKHRLALILYEYATKVAPNRIDAWFNKGVCYHYLNNLDAAINSFCQALRLNAGHSKSWLHLGKTLHRKENYRGAAFAFRQALLFNSHQIHAWTCLASSLLMLERHQESINACKKALEIKKNDLMARLQMIVNYRNLSKFDEASSICNDLIKDYPKIYKVVLEKGLLLRAMHMYEEAVLYFKQAIQIRRALEPYLEISDILFKTERFEEAIEFYEQALLIRPTCFEARISLGLAFEALGDMEKARKAFYDTILSSNGKSFPAFIHLGRICEILEDSEQASRAYGTLIKLLKQSIDAQSFQEVVLDRGLYEICETLINRQVIVLTNLNKFQESTGLCFEFSKLLGNAGIWVNCGARLFEMGKFKDSLESYRLALKIDPISFDAWYNSGNSYLQMEDYKRAIECYQEALAIDPDNAQAYNNLGSAQFFLGEYENALCSVDKALSYGRDQYSSLINKSLILKRICRFRESADLCLEASLIKPQDYYSWYLRGICLHELYDFVGAYEAYENVVKLDPANCRALNNMGVIGIHEKNFQEALVLLEKALEAAEGTPKSTDITQILHNKAVALNGIGRISEAEDIFNSNSIQLQVSPDLDLDFAEQEKWFKNMALSILY